MRFSVIMPAYNAEKYIRESIESITSQTFRDFELIIIDDGSRDKTGEISDTYAAKDSRIQVVHQKNMGVVPAKRKGIALAQGEFCLFCDADDIMAPHLMERVQDTLLAFAEPDIVMYQYAKFNEKETSEVILFPYGASTEIPIQEARKTLISSWTLNPLWIKAVRRELLIHDPLDYTVNYSDGYAEDKLQSLYPFDACKKVVALPECLYFYRYNTSGMIHQKIQIDKIRRRLYPEVCGIIEQYVKKWAMPGLEESFYSFEFSHFWNIYKLMVTKADSLREIQAINRFDWASCLCDGLARKDVRKKLPTKVYILGEMVLHANLLTALFVRFVFRYVKRDE